ncbi:MAG TPA: ABC transporter permease [bacterium]|nr:ABC transporter permease [bacterium]
MTLRPLWIRFRRNRGALLGAAVVVVFSVLGLVAPWVAPYDPLTQNLAQGLQPPSFAHPLGTDEVGRDILSRVIVGSRISLAIAFASVGLALVVGGSLGLLAGFCGGRVDSVVSRLLDVWLALPGLLLAIVIIAILGVGIDNVIISIALGGVPPYARVARGSTLSVKESGFVEAARSLGAPDLAIILRHIVPNILAFLLVQATLGIATALLTASGLSFLGLGAQPPTPEWGAMLADGRPYLISNPQVSVFPGFTIMLVALGFNLFGDGLLETVTPRKAR